jgi:putative heme-binding domain-containing protein
MLRPALQPGERLDFSLPAEHVTVSFASPGAAAPRVSFPGLAQPPALESTGDTVRMLRHNPRERTWLPVEVMLTTGTPDQPLHVSWSTAEDARPRALALRRVFVPWATPTENPTAPIAPPELAGGDRSRGKTLFAMCAMCHGLNSEGSRVGPDLSNLVHRDYASVVKDIVDPSATINPNHVGYVITLKSGDMLASVVLEDNTHTILLATPGGLPRLVPKSDIAEMKPMPVSLMPTGLDHALGPQGLKDLLTFLMLPPPYSAAKP